MSMIDHDTIDRMREQRATLRDSDRSAVALPTLGCGHGNVCEWMRGALGANDPRGVSFIRREMEHPDTLATVTRYVVTVGQRRPVLVRACPACGGNPNEETVTR